MNALLLAWYAQGPTAKRLWLLGAVGALLGGLHSWFAAELWLYPAPARVFSNGLLLLSLLLLAWLVPGLLWSLGKYFQRWWLRLLSMVLAIGGWCAALLVSLLVVPLGLAWLLFDVGS